MSHAGARNKVREGRPHIVDMIKNDEIDLIVNTTEGKQRHPRIALDPPRGRAAKGDLLHDAWRQRRHLRRHSTIRGPDVNRLQDLHTRSFGMHA